MTLGKAARDDTTSEFFDGTSGGEFLIRRSCLSGGIPLRIAFERPEGSEVIPVFRLSAIEE
jgi:hypothetical protein